MFIKKMSTVFDEIVVFTASAREYADAVIDSLSDVKHLINHRLYWEHVSKVQKATGRLTGQSITTNTDVDHNLSEGGPQSNVCED